MMKKLLAFLLALALLLASVGWDAASAASSRGSYSGGMRMPSTSSFSSGSMNKTYSSGKKAPSSQVTQSPRYNYSATQAQTGKSSLFGGGLGHFLGGMAAGTLFGSLFSSMLHPFSYGMMPGFSLLGLLLDALIAFVIYKLIRRFVWR